MEKSYLYSRNCVEVIMPFCVVIAILCLLFTVISFGYITILSNIPYQYSYKEPTIISINELNDDIEDGYYVSTNISDADLIKLLKNNEVLVYAEDSLDKLHFIKVKDHPKLISLTYKGKVNIKQIVQQ